MIPSLSIISEEWREKFCVRPFHVETVEVISQKKRNRERKYGQKLFKQKKEK